MDIADTNKQPPITIAMAFIIEIGSADTSP